MEQNLDAWKALVRRHAAYSASVYRSRLVMLIAETFLADYPKKLSPEVRKYIDAFEKLLSGGRASVASETDTSDTVANTKGTENETVLTWETDSILIATFGLMVFQLGKSKPSKFDFSQAVYSNEVVMQIAYLSGFMRDVIAEICRLRPELVMSAKQVGSAIRKRVNWFKGLGFDFEIAESRITWLEEAENVRHIIVHNDGRVDHQFLLRTGRKDLLVGEPFQLSSHYLLRVYTGSKVLAARLLSEVTEKFFGIPLSEVPNLMRQPQ